MTGGGPQSNHARITAAAARRTGLDCHLAVGRRARRPEGNLLLDELFGATLHFDGAGDYSEIEAAIETLAGGLPPRADGVRDPRRRCLDDRVAATRSRSTSCARNSTAPDWSVVADGSGRHART